VVLCIQAILSLRLIRVNTAFQDEALYLWAGHMEWSHWLHGTSMPLYATYFSGAPVLYPPLGALADSVGGLAGARILSLGFMLAATAALWGTTSRLYGKRAAFFAAALWSVLGPTLHLGAFATYDAMSLCFLALAGWCAVHAGLRRDETGWIAATAAALVLANATKYASALFDPVVVAIVILNAWPLPAGTKAAVSRGAALAAYVTSGAILLVTIGGGYYEAGIGQTTLTRVSGTDSPLLILDDSWSWTLAVLIVALAGIAIGILTERPPHRWLLLVVLTGAASLVPLEQARIQTLTSLDKHTDFGAWFAAIAAGYAVSKLVGFWRRRWLRGAATAVIAAALVVPIQRGAAQGLSLVEQWPNSARFYQAFGWLAVAHPGHFLVETPSIPEYYLPLGADWQLWSNTRSVVLPSGHSISSAVGQPGNPAVYARYIRRSYFSLVALDFYSTRTLDHEIAADLNGNPRYRVVADVPYGHGDYTIWARVTRAKGAR
jgi:Dolichyl-phosphate-mannose-protein mannosyltransferase